MKKTNAISIIISAACVMSIFAGCGKQTEETTSKKDSDKNTTTTVTTTITTTTTTEATTSTTLKEEPEQERIPAEAEIGENGAKAVCKVTLVPDENIDISQKVYFDDLYGRHVLHSGVVGLVGAPVEIIFDEEDVKSGKLIFTYDPDQLKGVRPDSLMFMWYNEDESYYVELETELDKDNNTVSIDIDKDGVYLIVNQYKWFDAWGIDLGDDGMDPDYDPTNDVVDYSLWEIHSYTGDIPAVADMDYIKFTVSDPDFSSFKVSNAQELASAVYYINVTESARNVDIILENDIDLAGIDWAPLGWYAAGVDYKYSGDIYGNGHTISNMTVKTNGNSGFIGNGFGSSICDLTFENAKVEGYTCGIVAADDLNVLMLNCHCTGEVNGTNAGTLLGEGIHAIFSNCTVDVVVNDVRETKYLSFSEKERQNVIDNTKITEKITVDKNFNVTREKGVEGRFGSLEWTITRGGVTVLQRNAENETTLHFTEFFDAPGHYTVKLSAYIDGYYVPISNTVEFDY